MGDDGLKERIGYPLFFFFRKDDRKLKRVSNNWLVPQIRTIFIILGNDCNFNCSYCMQRPRMHYNYKTDYNPEIVDLLIELTNRNRNPIHIQFYGGEPLLHFDTIKKIYEELGEERNKFTYSTICNGSLINDEVVDLFNKMDAMITVSYDGPNTSKTRHRDIFKEDKFKTYFYKLNHCAITSLVTAESYPFEIVEFSEKIKREYDSAHPYGDYQLNVDPVFDGGDTDPRILNIDLDRVRLEMSYLLNEYINYYLDEPFVFSAYQIYQYLESCVYNKPDNYDPNDKKRYRNPCGDGFCNLNIDMEGNLHFCHNCSDTYGNFKDNYWSLFDKLLSYDKTRDYNEMCQDCYVQPICNNGCFIIPKEVREKQYCKLKNAYAGPFMDFLLNSEKYMEQGYFIK